MAKGGDEKQHVERSGSDDIHQHYEFGGPFGTVMIMILSHVLVYYVWICITFYDGALDYPSSIYDIVPFCTSCLQLVMEFALPNLEALLVYGGFLIIQILLAVVMPGIIQYGMVVPSENNQALAYKCNGVAAWYASLAIAFGLHYSGFFPLQKIVHNFGPILTVSVIIANSASVAAYFTAYIMKKQHRMSGNIIYDYFMGAWLNPRIGLLDFKFFAETRVAWIWLFILTLSAAMDQLDKEGKIGAPMYLMLLAHGLYTNAVMKGEECIVSTWDIFYEKWGWMLIFWNFTGVPFVYCAQSLFLTKQHILYHRHPLITATLFVILLGAYYIWDTSQSQKNRFRLQLRGCFVQRNTFPQLPWGTLTDPKYMKTKAGSPLLIDGWWKYARKIHYTMDVIMALVWGFNCGISHALPYLYFFFFLTMIIHRYLRDRQRLVAKYQQDWYEYEKIVPYVFIPYVF